MITQRKCENCDRVFAIRSGNQRYCCEACAEQAKQNRKKRRNDFINAVEQFIDLQNQKYLSFSKAALLMGCTQQYIIYKLVGQGWLYTCAKRYHIRTCRIAGRVYYSKPDIDTHFGVVADIRHNRMADHCERNNSA